jgi:hypothetical protein
LFDFLKNGGILWKDKHQPRRKGVGISAPTGYTIHHRKRREDGGDDSDRNISFVSAEHHQAWNLLFDRYPNEKVAFKLEKYWKKFGEGKAVLMARQIVLNLLESHQKSRRNKLFNSKSLRQVINLTNINSKSEAKKLCAWILLFDNLSLDEILEICNKVWLDPDIEFFTKSKTAKISIRKKKN